MELEEGLSPSGTFSHAETIVPLTQYSDHSERYDSLQNLSIDGDQEPSEGSSTSRPSTFGVGFDSQSTFRTVNSP